MSTTALIWLLVFSAGLALSFREPFFGLLAYLLDYYFHPPLHWWGKDLLDLRWSLIAAAVFFISYLLHRRKLWDREILQHPQTIWLLLFLFVAVAVTPFAVSVDRSIHYLEDLAKLTLLYLLIVGTVRSPNQFRWFVLVMIIGGMIWGIDAFIDPKREAGRLYGVGGPDSDNDNSTASHLLTTIPFLGIYFLIGTKWEKALCVLAAPFILNTLILCNSRGATLAIGVTGVAGLFLARGKARFQIAAMGLLAGVLFVTLVDPEFIGRQVTVMNYEEDGSAMGRIESWKGALRLMSDHPFGTGGGGFDVLSPVYIPEIVAAHGGEERGVHNTYLWVGSDWGVLGLFCFLGFIGSTLLELHRIRNETTDERFRLQGLAIELALIGFLTAAFFSNRPYAEILYWLAGLTAALRNIQLKADQPVRNEPVVIQEGLWIQRSESSLLNR